MSARVLVVDDMPPNLKLLEAKLSREYYEVILAQSGMDCLEKAKKLSPDIILLDVMMPGMDGFETCRRLRADPDLLHIPVIMVTALSEKEDRVHGLEAGADDFLTKPVNDTALFARVRSLVRLKVMMDELRLRGLTTFDLGLDPNSSSIGSIADSKILLIDDDAIQSNQLILKLSSVNKHIKLVNEPDKAVDEAIKGDYDLILISTQLMTADGLRICSQLRSNDQTRNVSILILIDEHDTEALVKGLEMGINDYIITPVDVNELVARVKTQVRRKKFQDALRSNYKTTANLAITDPLTGLYNRRFLDSHIENIMKEAVEYKRPFSVMIMDIDHFKSVNDIDLGGFGHQVGDEVLKEFAQRMLNNIRPSDLAVRYGGDEFVILLPGTDKNSAQVVGDRLRANIETEHFNISAEPNKLAKTISIGIAELQTGDSAADLIKRADSGLYKAKNNGRNRIEIAE